MEAKIDPRELRIGNIHKVDPISIFREGIYCSEFARITGHGISLAEMGIMDVYPIPLTEEILRKSGFAFHHVRKVWVKEGLHGNIRECAKGFRYKCYWIEVCVDHVHQLQNLYAILQNRELEIKL